MHSIQTTPESDCTGCRVLHKEANTFNLTVTLSDSRLVLTLKDFVDWAIYEKEYTENDIGVEIHPKMDLSQCVFLSDSAVSGSTTDDKSSCDR